MSSFVTERHENEHHSDNGGAVGDRRLEKENIYIFSSCKILCLERRTLHALASLRQRVFCDAAIDFSSRRYVVTRLAYNCHLFRLLDSAVADDGRRPTRDERHNGGDGSLNTFRHDGTNMLMRLIGKNMHAKQ